MSVSLKINGSNTVNYLVHSLDLELEYALAPAWWVSLHYDPISLNHTGRLLSWWQSWRLLPSRGTVKLVVNGNQDCLTILRWRPFPQKIVVPIKPDYFKLKEIRIPESFNENVNYPKMPERFAMLSDFNLPACIPVSNDFKLKNTVLSVRLPWEELEHRIKKQKL